MLPSKKVWVNLLKPRIYQCEVRFPVSRYTINLLYIYDKSDLANISAKELLIVIKTHNASPDSFSSYSFVYLHPLPYPYLYGLVSHQKIRLYVLDYSLSSPVNRFFIFMCSGLSGILK